MNPEEGVRFEIATRATYLPRDRGFRSRSRSTILIKIYNAIEELVEDQNGMVTHVGTYRDPGVPHFWLKPINYTPRVISHHLHQFIPDTAFCRNLSHMIASECAKLRGPFLLSADVSVIRHVRFMLPPVVNLLSEAASGDVLQRLMDEQRVELHDLQEEEEAASSSSCSICLEDLSEPSGENLIKMPDCLHVFHEGCLFEWLKLHNSCPLCRRVPYEDCDH